jgi:hypothetical protein
MGQRIRNNFNKRFGGRIRVVYAQKLSVEEKQLLNERLCKAMIQVLSGILGREPTQRELLGIDDISQCRLKKNK